jgi:hypothetical protein
MTLTSAYCSAETVSVIRDWVASIRPTPWNADPIEQDWPNLNSQILVIPNGCADLRIPSALLVGV